MNTLMHFFAQIHHIKKKDIHFVQRKRLIVPEIGFCKKILILPKNVISAIRMKMITTYQANSAQYQSFLKKKT